MQNVETVIVGAGRPVWPPPSACGIGAATA